MAAIAAGKPFGTRFLTFGKASNLSDRLISCKIGDLKTIK
jgi:hypothetical protein